MVVFHRIIQEIHDKLREKCCIAIGIKRVCIHVHLDMLGICLWRNEISCIPHQAVHSDGLPCDGGLCLLDLRKMHDGIDQCHHSLGFIHDAAAEEPHLLGLLVHTIGNHFCEPADRGQRCLQLMRNIGREFAAHFFSHIRSRHITKYDEKTGFSVGEYDPIHDHTEGLIKKVHGVLLLPLTVVGFADDAKPVLIMIKARYTAEALVFVRMENIFDRLIVIDDLPAAIQKDDAVCDGIDHDADRISFLFDILHIVFDIIVLLFDLADERTQFLIFRRQLVHLLPLHDTLHEVSQEMEGFQNAFCLPFRSSQTAHGEDQEEDEDLRQVGGVAFVIHHASA